MAGKHRGGRIALGLTAALLAGCHPVYLAQMAAGQAAILRERRPVAEMLRDQSTTPGLRHKLEVTEQALQFAHQDLALPDNGSYRQYVALDRPFPVWNVFAAPEFGLKLRTWCFPVAGCAAYRGYFSREGADKFAAGESGRGDDVYVGGAVAYSTLGYFRDPLLSSVAALDDTELAGVIFHELAHQQFYVGDDTVFNESFATLVEQEGLVRWLGTRGDKAALCRYLAGLERERRVRALISDTRRRLRVLYASGQSEADLRAAKALEFDALVNRYRQMRAGWVSPPFFDGWFTAPLNNARLGALEAYDRDVGALRVVLESEGGRLPAFYRRVARLGRLTATDRAQVLQEIRTPSLLGPSPACGAGGALSGSAATGPASRGGSTG